MGALSDYRAYSVAELRNFIDRFVIAPTVSGHGDGASGHHAWIGIAVGGFTLAVYFGEETKDDGRVDFNLYGPYPAGTELDRHDPYDGRGLEGEMSIRSLKRVVKLLDQSQTPLEYVRRHAGHMSIIRD